MPNLVELIKKASLEAMNDSMPAGIFFGTIKSTSPLKINIEQKMTLDSSHLVLTKLASTYNLEVGEKVILIRVQGGQKYIVLDKVG